MGAFANTSPNKKIIVPDELYDEWIAATNWNSDTNGIRPSIVRAYDFENPPEETEYNQTRLVYSEESGLPEVEMSIQSLDAPDTIPNVGDLVELHIGKETTSISYYAFANATKLKEVTIPSTLNVQYDPFYTVDTVERFTVSEDNQTCKSVNGLLLSKDGKTIIHGVNRNVVIPGTVESIRESAFYGMANLAEISIPDSVKTINSRAFAASGLASVTFGSGLQNILYAAFDGCSALEHISLPPVECGNQVFSSSGVKTVEFLSGTTSIPNGIFLACRQLRSVIIPDGVVSIASSAFQGCSSLGHIVLPDTLRNIDARAFGSCSSLSEVTFLGPPPTIAVNGQPSDLNHPFYGIAQGAAANVDSEAGDWPENGTSWNGLTIRRISDNPIEDPDIVQEFDNIEQQYPIPEDEEYEEGDDEEIDPEDYVPYFDHSVP